MGRSMRFWLTMLVVSSFNHTAQAQSNFYFSGAIGRADADVDAGVIGARVKRIAGDDTSFALGVGYRFRRFLSVESTYQDFGRFPGNRNTCAAVLCTQVAYPVEPVDASALVVSAIASFRISERVTGYGKVGVADWDFTSASAIYDDSGRDPQLGGGFRWSFDKRWDIFVDYAKTNFDIDALAVGVNFELGR